MKLHGNARTCLHGRRLMVERVLDQGWTLAAAAGVAPRGARRKSYGLSSAVTFQSIQLQTIIM